MNDVEHVYLISLPRCLSRTEPFFKIGTSHWRRIGGDGRRRLKVYDRSAIEDKS